ncbi:hypothetical protein JCM18899A_08580 [Nocardioides sp. AN3]
MDPSALIFLGLALAWAAYLIPKALEHHEAGARTRSVDKFSHRLRVLARREPVDRRSTRLVTSRKPATHREPLDDVAPVADDLADAVSDVAPDAVPDVVPDLEQTGFFAAQTFVRRSAASRAARRRRRVLGSLLLLFAMVGALAAGQVISSWWVVLPVTLVVGWLVACRKMVTWERAANRRPPVPRVTDRVERDATGSHAAISDDTAEVPVVHAQVAEPIASGDGWELVPVTLPTYVSKPAAPRRAVNAIDLDSTGVWTSGRTAADSVLAQQASAVRSAPAEAAPAQRRASGA